MQRTFGLILLSAFAIGACDDDDSGDDTAADTGHGSPGHESSADHHAGDTADGDTANGDTMGAAGDAVAYCNCLLVNCHDPFHERYGEADQDAVPACNEAAAVLPVVGMDVMEGDSLECRQHFCDEAMTDASSCAAALGDEVCV